MAVDLKLLHERLTRLLGSKVAGLESRLGELTLTVQPGDMLEVFGQLRDDAELRFELLIDVCGMDYSTYGSDVSEGGAYFKSDFAPEVFPNLSSATNRYPHWMFRSRPR